MELDEQQYDGRKEKVFSKLRFKRETKHHLLRLYLDRLCDYSAGDSSDTDRFCLKVDN